jgi:hypothetical protein
MADEHYALGYKKLQAAELKSLYVKALIRLWQAQGLALGTLQNRMAAMRRWAKKVGWAGR